MGKESSNRVSAIHFSIHQMCIAPVSARDIELLFSEPWGPHLQSEDLGQNPVSHQRCWHLGVGVSYSWMEMLGRVSSKSGPAH